MSVDSLRTQAEQCRAREWTAERTAAFLDASVAYVRQVWAAQDAAMQHVDGDVENNRRRVDKQPETPVEPGDDDERSSIVVGLSHAERMAKLEAVLQRAEQIRDELTDAMRTYRCIRPCGTHAAFNRHRKRNEEPCEACWNAERAYQAERARRKRAKRRSEAA